MLMDFSSSWCRFKPGGDIMPCEAYFPLPPQTLPGLNGLVIQ